MLVLERLLVFRDRVRGEALYPWGVAEARTLGFYRLLLGTCAHEARFWSMYALSMLTQHRDLTRSGPHRAGALTFYHPEMQEAISVAAEAAGAEVCRGVEVVEVTPGNPTAVHAVANGEVKTFRARLVIGADGRNSKVRGWGRFRVDSDPQRLVITGVLLKGMSVAEDSGVCAGSGLPVVACKQMLTQSAHVAKRERKPTAPTRISRCRRIADQCDAVAIRVSHPRICAIERSDWTSSFNVRLS